MTDEPAPEPPGVEQERLAISAIRQSRELRGWSQGDLARRMRDLGWEGFHQTTISRIEKGERPLRFAEVHAFAEALGESTSDLLLGGQDAAVRRLASEAGSEGQALREAVKRYAEALAYIAVRAAIDGDELSRMTRGRLMYLRKRTPLAVAREALNDARNDSTTDARVSDRYLQGIRADGHARGSELEDGRSKEILEWVEEIYGLEDS